MDRAADDRAQAPSWLPDSFLKPTARPTCEFEGYQYFTFPMDHAEFSRTGVIGNPMTATAEKGEEALERFSDHLVRAIDEFRAAGGATCAGGSSRSACEHARRQPCAVRRSSSASSATAACPVADLARDLTVSSITVHRDLEQLSQRRVWSSASTAARGRCPAPGRRRRSRPPAGSSAPRSARGAKAAIAAHAAREVRSGSTIFLDSSSSCLALARQLVSEPATELTLVTNSPAIAYELVDERILVIVTPGELDQHMRLLAGRWTTDFLSGLNFELAFCSCAGRHARTPG